MFVEDPKSSNKGGGVATSNTTWGGDVKLPSSCIMEHFFIAGLLFLTMYMVYEDEYSPLQS